MLFLFYFTSLCVYLSAVFSEFTFGIFFPSFCSNMGIFEQKERKNLFKIIPKIAIS